MLKFKTHPFVDSSQWEGCKLQAKCACLWTLTRGFSNHADSRSTGEMAADGGSTSHGLPCVFSPQSRQYLALCAQDGRLRIWNTDSKTLHQEYVPSAHLSATCTCIAWGPCRTVKVCGGQRCFTTLRPCGNAYVVTGRRQYSEYTVFLC